MDGRGVDTPDINTPGTGVSRRQVLCGATIGGAVIWATPVIHTGSAWATGGAGGSFPGTGFSEIAVVLRKGNTYYRVKYEFGGNSFTSSSNPAEPIDNSCGSMLFPRVEKYTATNKYLLPPSNIFAPDPNYTEGGSFRAVLGPGVSLVAYFVHQGSCCAFLETPKPGTAPTPPAMPTTYEGCTIDYVVHSTVQSGATLVTFPPAYNKCEDAC